MSQLDDASRQRAMRLCLADGAVFALMVGMGETYFLANAVRLHATPMQLGLTVSLPLCLGALGPLLTLSALRGLRRRKIWTVGSVVVQAAVLLSISLFDRQGGLSVGLLIAAACSYQIAGMAAGTAWSSWFGDLVPAEQRGRYFSRRNRLVQLFTLVGLLTAGLLLQWLEPAPGSTSSSTGTGFQVIFEAAACARVISALLLTLSPEGQFAGISRPRQLFRFVGTERGQTAWRLLLAAASLQLATYTASPYFTPFMLRELNFSYLEYMTATICVVAGKFFILPLWGRSIDQHGPRPVYLLITVMVALVPIPWLWARNLWWVLPAQLFSGVTWSGYEVSYFSLLLDSSYKRTRAYVFAAQNVLNGSAQLAGATLGGLLLGILDRNLRLIFGISAAIRLVIALLMPRFLPPAPLDHPRRRDLALRLVGFRPSGGVVHRPILGGEDGDDDEEAKAS